ncbi:ComF family protein [Calditrichota bacterium]
MRSVTKYQMQSFIKNLHPKYFDEIYIIFDFSEIFQKIIHLLKYERCISISNYFAGEIDSRFNQSFLIAYDLIIPVPLHPVKFRERGYNQSFEILSHLQGNVRKDVLVRIKNTVSQTKLSREQRIENVNNAFFCNQSFKGAKILLFDDIITTGSTLNACTVALKDSGCSKVDVLALATPGPDAN